MPENITVSCISEVPGAQDIVATDTCDDSPIVVFSQSELPSCNGQVINTWTATDACGNKTSYSQIVTIIDTVAPTFTSDLPESTTVECSAIPSAADVTAMDNCGGEVSVTYNEVINSEEGSCTQNYTITRTWSAEDCAGNAVVHSQIITVVDTTAPEIIDAPDSEISVTCSYIPEPAVIVAVDNCSSNIQINFEETITDVDNNGVYQIIRLWTIEDVCGNTTMFTQTISVLPLEIEANEPVLVYTEDDPVDLNNLINAGAVAGGTWTDDDSSGALNGSIFDPSEADPGQYHLTYTSNEDGCIVLYTILIIVREKDPAPPCVDCEVLPCQSPSNIEISKVVTSNNDGINDTFEISDVSACGFVPAVQIFNRWGKLVYQSDNYQNTWRGFNEGGGPTIGSGDKLPTGTYYYIVNILGSGFAPITGYIYLGTN
jgi:gliding motility-associated-like protein